MKASVITMHAVDNYGSAMQTYATKQILNKLGYEVEFVDYWRKDNQPKFKAEKLLSGKFMQKFKFIWDFNEFTKNTMINIITTYLKKNTSPMWKFVENNVDLSEKRYFSYEEIKINPPIADVYITGSDQVWNSIWNQGIDRAYFLDFAPLGKPRISFSASIGRDKLDAGEIAETKSLLEKYKDISVREQSAVDLLNSLGINSTLVLDPTLMLNGESWRKIAEIDNELKPFLLIYQLNPNPDMDKYAERLAENNNWKILRIGFGTSDKNKSGRCIMLPSVEKFLGLFCQASCVLTDSFHATAFSLNLGTDFISVLPNRFGTRIKSITTLTKTEHRVLTDYNDFEIIDKKIDKNNVEKILEHEREKGYLFLRRALEVEES